MAYITFKGEKPRRLRFGFNAMGYLQSSHGIVDIQKFVKEMEKGNIYNIALLMNCFLVGDNEGLTTSKINDLLDDFILEEGMDKLSQIITETMEESAVFKDANKKKLKAENKKK